MKRLIGILLLAGLSVPVLAHEDIYFTVTGGKFVTGKEENGSYEFPVHVFGMDLGEDPTEPFSGDDPGFENLPGTLSAGQLVGFNFTRQIARWDGSTFVNVSNTVTGEFAVGPNLLSATSGTGFSNGFFIPVDTAGEWHNHINWTLNGVNGGTPTTGVYRLGLQLVSQGGPAASDEFWIIMNNGDTEANHDAAKEYAIQTVPEPMTMAALAAGVALMGRRRKRTTA